MFLFWFIHQIFLSANINGNVGKKHRSHYVSNDINLFKSLTKLYGKYSLKFSSDVLNFSLCHPSSGSYLGIKVIIFL